MQNLSVPLSRDIVLIGGGHSHALVLRKWGMAPLPGARLTVINPGPTAPYSGMLPGFLAGHYKRSDLDIDLVKLSRFAGARFVIGSAAGIDKAAQVISVSGYPDIAYDFASIDIGITSAMPLLPGFAEFGVPAKPLDIFAKRWAQFRKQTGHANIAVIGGGVAGAEIAMAFAQALRADNRRYSIHLVDRGGILDALSDRSRAKICAALRHLSIELWDNTQIAAVTADGLILDDGREISASFVCGAAGAKPHDWLASTGLDLQGGFVTVSDTLQSSDPKIFAVGDCAHMAQSPRPKAGVFAVRQADTLLKNLRLCAQNTGALHAYHPQKDYLKLISLGAKSALGDRFGLSFQGPWIWKWKNQIDQKFMNKFRKLPQMPSPDWPKDIAAGSREVLGDKPMCGGCGSKVGRGALQSALANVPLFQRPDVQELPGDDAAMLLTGGAKQVISTDHLRAMTDDPVVMTRIAANHALGDIWAMGATPQAALASVILPRMSPELAERSLREIMTTANQCFAQAGASIVGGHSSQGTEMTIGFAITGLCENAPISLSGAQPGDNLILTKPIGTGVIMAAEMAGQAHGDWVASALAQMSHPNGAAATLLSHASAMTDVTGFGLAGHLMNICQMSGTGAELLMSCVPILDGALELSQEGIRSTLFSENADVLPHLVRDPLTDLLFDPQTAGGFLAAISGDVTETLAQLRRQGFQAAHIGTLTADIGQISIS